MKIIFWGKGPRGFKCLERVLKKKYHIDLVVGHDNDAGGENSIITLAKNNGIETATPANPNEKCFEEFLRRRDADLFVLAGYGKILKKNIIEIPKKSCINLHGGKLPEYKGSSPLNWALINGEKEFTLSIIQVDSGIDTGPVLKEATFEIENHFTITELHQIAIQEFPGMLISVLDDIRQNKISIRCQNHAEGAYFPLRFPDDGFILFDRFTAKQIHQRIKALTEPYPCAFTIFKGRKIKFLLSELTSSPYYGEAGRIYKKNSKGILIAASDQCLWITKAIWEDTKDDALTDIIRYDQFPSTQNIILTILKKSVI